MKVSAVLLGRKDNQGKQTVYIRTNIGDKRTFKATRIRVLKSQFLKGKIKDHPNAKLYNEIIRDAIHEAEAIELKNEKKYPDADYRTYLNKSLDQWENEKSPDTVWHIKNRNEQFLKWNGETKLGRVTPEKLNEYKSYLNRLYNGSNTVWNALMRMRVLYTKARKENVIQTDPFYQFTIPPYRHPRKSFLTMEQVHKIESYSLSNKNSYGIWFVIGCYTGLRYSDMHQFDRDKHINGNRLILYTKKTGELVSIPLTDKIKQLFEAVNYKRLKTSNSWTNLKLRDVRKACKISLPLTVHLSRHTFGVRCASAGIPIEVTAKLMGHSDTKSTMVYYHITGNKIDAEFSKLV